MKLKDFADLTKRELLDRALLEEQRAAYRNKYKKYETNKQWKQYDDHIFVKWEVKEQEQAKKALEKAEKQAAASKLKEEMKAEALKAKEDKKNQLELSKQVSAAEKLKEIIENTKIIEGNFPTLNAIDDLFETMHDTGNADRFIQHNPLKAKYIVEEGDWVLWKKGRWVRDKKKTEIKGMLKTAVSQFDMEVNTLIKEATLAKIPEDTGVFKKTAQLLNWSRQSKNARTINSSLEVLSSYPDIAESILEFDKKGHYLGVQNGVLNLKTGELIANDPRYLMLKTAAVNYNKKADCPRFKKFLSEVFDDDADKIKTIQQIFGSSLVGITKDKFFIFLGGGSNGKTTLVSIINKVLGTADKDGYSITTSPRVFMDQQQNNTEYYMARLKGARLLYMSETDATSTLKDDLVKQVTPDNDEQVTARKPKGEVFEYCVVATPILLTNNKPRVKDATEGMWRRLELIQFNRHFTAADKDRTLMTTLDKEKEGILNWCLEGAAQYLNNGNEIFIADSVKFDTEMWKTNEDAIQTFWDSKFDENPNERVLLKTIKTKWDEWCDEMGGYKYDSRTLLRHLENRGVKFEIGTSNLTYAVGYSENQFESIKDTLQDKKSTVKDLLDFKKNTR